MEHGLENKVTLYHVPKGQESGELYKRSEDRNSEKDNLKRHLVEESQCRATGILPLPKVVQSIDRLRELSSSELAGRTT